MCCILIRSTESSSCVSRGWCFGDAAMCELLVDSSTALRNDLLKCCKMYAGYACFPIALQF